MRVEEKEDPLRDYLTKYILKRCGARDEATLKIVEERDRHYSRLLSNSEEILTDKKVFSIACAVIEAFKDRDKDYPAFGTGTDPLGFIFVHSCDGEYFSEATLSVLGLKYFDVRNLFCKYFLGFICDWSSRRHNYYRLVIYPLCDPHNRETRERGL